MPIVVTTKLYNKRYSIYYLLFVHSWPKNMRKKSSPTLRKKMSLIKLKHWMMILNMFL